MNKPSPLIWLTLALIFLLPTAAGRFLLDLAGGLMIAFLALPILLTGLGWLGWRALQSKMVTCEVCGVRSFVDSGLCPMCGSELPNTNKSSAAKTKLETSLPASAATIDVIAEDPESEA